MSRKRRWSGSILRAIRSPPSDHQVHEALGALIVDPQALAALARGQPLLQHAQRPREHRYRLIGLELGHQLEQQLRRLAVHLHVHRWELGVHQSLTSPLAKMLATKFSTSVEQISQ